MHEKLKVLVVDDEPLALRKIVRMLEKEADVVLFQASNGTEALSIMEKEHPDLVLLDIQMPGMDGLQVLRSCTLQPLPYVIFVTAYDQYAIDAFEAHALDYLLKPFARKRFQQSLERARKYIQRDRALQEQAGLRALINQIKRADVYLERILVRKEERVLLVRTQDILWIEAAGKYVKIHSENQTYEVRAGISRLESQLNPAEFTRIHRSYIVNVDRIQELQLMFHGDYQVLLENGTKLMLSRRYWTKLQKALSNQN